MRTIDIVTKRAEPRRVALTTGVAAGHGYANVHPVFEERLPIVWARLEAAAVEPGICVAQFEWPDDDGKMVVHLGFDIDDQPLADDDDVRVVELPAVDVASALHRGALVDFSETFEAVVRWIDGNGYRIADRSRELYLVSNPDDRERNVTELQLPITSASLGKT